MLVNVAEILISTLTFFIRLSGTDEGDPHQCCLSIQAGHFAPKGPLRCCVSCPSFFSEKRVSGRMVFLYRSLIAYFVLLMLLPLQTVCGYTARHLVLHKFPCTIWCLSHKHLCGGMSPFLIIFLPPPATAWRRPCNRFFVRGPWSVVCRPSSVVCLHF